MFRTDSTLEYGGWVITLNIPFTYNNNNNNNLTKHGFMFLNLGHIICMRDNDITWDLKLNQGKVGFKPQLYRLKIEWI